MVKRPIFYDTETTGIRASEDRIIELAAFDPTRGTTFDQLIDPECPIPPEASAIHKITDSMVAGKPTFQKVAAEFATFCEGEVVLIAHNNDGFDRHFLRAEYTRAGHPEPPWEHFDTLKWARRYRPDLPRHSLQFLRATYGFEENNAHRALDDVIVLHQIYCALVDDLTIEEALSLLGASKAITKMPFGKYRGTPLKDIPSDYIAYLKREGAFDKPGNEELRESLTALGVL
ncbi:MAG: DUF3820 family protein [Parachlamydiales bacterium]